jgi:hypothetical protein
MISDSVEIKEEWGRAFKFPPSQTPLTPYPHLLALGLPSAFAYYFAQTMSLRKAPFFFEMP